MSLPFAHPTMLAPMEGVTHPLFRDLIAGMPGVGCVCTEFVRISSEPYSHEKIAKEVVKSPGVPLSVQVMGRAVEPMADAAAAVSLAGADVVDINLGCPSRNAARSGVGAAMLKEPAVLREVLMAMRAKTPGLLSAKIRAGFDDARQVIALAEIVEDCGADYIVVHPRRRIDYYNGVADWRTISLVKQSLGIPVVGNGDCWYAHDALRMQEETGCDGVMLGRPALRNPWVFAQIAALRAGLPAPRPTGEMLYELIEHLARTYQERFGRAALGMLKELLSYLGRVVNDGGLFRRTALRAPTLDLLLGVCAELVALPAAALDMGPEGEHALERSGTAKSAVQSA